jgi:hypothetical protein
VNAWATGYAVPSALLRWIRPLAASIGCGGRGDRPRGAALVVHAFCAAMVHLRRGWSASRASRPASTWSGVRSPRAYDASRGRRSHRGRLGVAPSTGGLGRRAACPDRGPRRARGAAPDPDWTARHQQDCPRARRRGAGRRPVPRRGRLGRSRSNANGGSRVGRSRPDAADQPLPGGDPRLAGSRRTCATGPACSSSTRARR